MSFLFCEAAGGRTGAIGVMQNLYPFKSSSQVTVHLKGLWLNIWVGDPKGHGLNPQ